MKTLSQIIRLQMFVWFIAVALLFVVNTPTLAADLSNNIFLPVIAQENAVLDGAVLGPTVAQVSRPTFNPLRDLNVTHNPDLTRLQRLDENGGYIEKDEVVCGKNNRLEVYVFNSEMDFPLTVEVSHVDQDGKRWIEQRDILNQDGARFDLYERATVRIVPSAANREASSVTMTISTDPNQIPIEDLIRGRYCHDAETCQAFVEADTCHGSFSWNVVFTGQGSTLASSQ